MSVQIHPYSLKSGGGTSVLLLIVLIVNSVSTIVRLPGLVNSKPAVTTPSSPCDSSSAWGVVEVMVRFIMVRFIYLGSRTSEEIA